MSHARRPHTADTKILVYTHITHYAYALLALLEWEFFFFEISPFPSDSDNLLLSAENGSQLTTRMAD